LVGPSAYALGSHGLQTGVRREDKPGRIMRRWDFDDCCSQMAGGKSWSSSFRIWNQHKYAPGVLCCL